MILTRWIPARCKALCSVLNTYRVSFRETEVLRSKTVVSLKTNSNFLNRISKNRMMSTKTPPTSAKCGKQYITEIVSIEDMCKRTFIIGPQALKQRDEQRGSHRASMSYCTGSGL